MKKYFLIFSKFVLVYLFAAIVVTLYLFRNKIGAPAHAHVPFSGGFWFLVFSPSIPFMIFKFGLETIEIITATIIFVSSFPAGYYLLSKLGLLMARN